MSTLVGPWPLDHPVNTTRFWRGHIAAGFGILGAESTASAVYLLTARGPHRGDLFAVVGVFGFVSIAGGLSAGWLSVRSWRHTFALWMSVLCIVGLTSCAWLDGGVESPFLYMDLLPIMFTGLLLRPKAVALSGVATLGGIVVVGLTDAHVELPQESVMMMCVVAAGAFSLAVISSAYRDRLEADRERLVRRLQAMAATDMLTGCSNQHVFHERLAEEFDRARRFGRPLSLVVCDVDLFKSFNDTYGHEQGDTALCQIGGRLRGVCRATDVVGRVGGDEFAILLPETSLAEANQLVARVMQAQALLRPGDPPPVSLGVAELGPDDPGPVALFNRADFAMYEAKAARRDPTLDGQRRATFDHFCPDARRSAEAARREKRQRLESETLLEAVLEEVPVGFALIDSDLRVVRANSILTAWNGQLHDRYLGRQLDQVLPEWWPTIGPHLKQVIRDGLPVQNLELDAPTDGVNQSEVKLANFYPVRLNGRTAAIGAVFIDITDRKRLERSQERLTDAVVGALAAAAEARDPYTAGHQRRVADIAAAIATDLGYDPTTTKGIRLAASIHDIGKIGIPSEILTKPGPLTSAEYEVIKGHCQIGFDMLAGIEFPWPVADMVLQHHERLDGSGYPYGLPANQIGPGSRIIAIADVVEAMGTHRPYRSAPGVEAAIAEITDGRSTRYDADAVDTCVRLVANGAINIGETTQRLTSNVR